MAQVIFSNVVRGQCILRTILQQQRKWFMKMPIDLKKQRLGHGFGIAIIA